MSERVAAWGLHACGVSPETIKGHLYPQFKSNLILAAFDLPKKNLTKRFFSKRLFLMQKNTVMGRIFYFHGVSVLKSEKSEKSERKREKRFVKCGKWCYIMGYTIKKYQYKNSVTAERDFQHVR